MENTDANLKALKAENKCFKERISSKMLVVTEYCVRYFTLFMEKGKQFILSRQEVKGVKLRAKKEGVAQLTTSTPEVDIAINIAV